MKLLQLRSLLILLLLFFGFHSSIAQKNKIDSLEKVVQNYSDQDTTLVNKLTQLGFMYWSVNPIRGQKLGEQALTLSKELNYQRGIHQSYRTLGASYFSLAKYGNALEAFFGALREAELLGDYKIIASSLQNIGVIYSAQGNYRESLSYYFRADSVRNSYDKGNSASKQVTYSNIGEAYMHLGMYDSAYYYVTESIEMGKGTSGGVRGDALSILASVLSNQGKLQEALTILEEAIELMEGEGNRINLIDAYYRKARTVLAVGELKNAYKSLQRGMQLAHEANAKDKVRDGYLLQHDLLIEEGKYEDALEYHHKYKELNDEIYKEQKTQQLAQYQAQYEIEQKQKEFELGQERLKLQDAQLERQNWVMFSMGGGILSMFVFGFILIRNNLIRKKTNKILTSQKEQLHGQQQELIAQTEELRQLNEETQAQRDHLSEVNNELQDYNQRITDSISAAQTIQEALLPFEDRMNHSFSDHFVVYRPKDIVSGDFYWLAEKEGSLFLAVIDCSGHGVPGAFMSMLAYSLLNEVIETTPEYDPASILTLLHDKVTYAISHTKHGKNHDAGMDIGICKFDYKEDSCDVTYAGAKRPLYYIKNNELEKFKGDNLTVGGLKKIDENRKFQNFEIVLNKGEQVYLSTDGYVDNPNEDRKKFGTPKFEKLLRDMHSLTMSEQGTHIISSMEDFQNDAEQRDDITLLGVRI